MSQIPPAPAAPASPGPRPQAFASPTSPPAASGPMPVRATHLDDDLESTIVVVHGAASTETGWMLVDIDGTEFPLHRSNVLGRRPRADRAPAGAQVISLSDRSRVLSRTHVLIEVDRDTLWVTDLHSTNGTMVLERIGDDIARGQECAPGTAVPLPPGAVLDLGGRRVSFRAPQPHESRARR